MVGSLLLLKLLHCRKRCEASSSTSHKEESGSADSQRAKKFNDRKSYRKYPENTCRVCLKEADIDLPIFGGQDAADISQTLSTFGGIEISEDDDYPKYLCRSCHALLQGAILLRATAQKSDRVLKKPLKHVTAKVTNNFVKTDQSDNFDDSMDFDDVEEKHVPQQQRRDYQKNYHCSRCNLEFASAKEYRDHRLSNDHQKRQITCDVCNKTYSIVYYKKHRAIHGPDCPYICDICGKKFVALGAFSRHRLTHFYELPFKCSLCPYRGRFTESLKMHMRTHTGEKPYQCTECARQFINKSNLNKHMFTHKDPNFKCDSCGNGFYTKRDLEIHFKVRHAGIKDHLCNICNKAFGTRKQMMKHLLKVHKRQKLRSGRLPLYLQVEKMQENNGT